MDELTRSIAQLLAQRAYREGQVVLSSGRVSNYYLDAKQVTYDPEGFAAVGRAVLERIEPFDVVAVGGPTMGADAIVCATLNAAAQAGIRLPGFIVRKESKAHGLQKMIEGIRPPEGSRVAIVEDVVTSGGSVLRAVYAARDAGLVVPVVVALVDREEGARETITAEGPEFVPVCTVSDIRRAAGQAAAGPA